MRYKVIESCCVSNLVDDVNNWLKDGWETLGGIAFNGTRCYQTLIRHDK